ncbi:uncharacterized protein LAESUDRAFT_737504 [Laetiporus sulphureus 93-53]|uniref:Pali-domain-containing protein n=1 Tax=Laetiporus sulphureus 93-53 TaxID=1314785 RepID=A0A165DPR0_9APHY|nr:uncharacterized protein LAESUDRAFT_737504 [Laetiporus sulphureus 93-53]KZT05355.1 hypothetical protein LAESUDRAFT_737504 [Laetiporus sulphureus 93-53]
MIIIDQLQQWERPRPLAKHLGISITTCVLYFISFLLYLLVALSLPIIKSIFLFEIKFGVEDGDVATAVATDLRFGVWGVCALSVIPGFEVCYGPTLGYTIPESILTLTGYPSLVEDVVEALTVLLVLHPVCAGLSFLCMFTSLFLESHAMTIISLIISILTIILGCVVFAADLALVIVGRIRISALTDFSYYVNWGPGVWMILAAVICLFAGMVLLSMVVCECCGVGVEYDDEDEKGDWKRRFTKIGSRLPEMRSILSRSSK